MRIKTLSLSCLFFIGCNLSDEQLNKIFSIAEDQSNKIIAQTYIPEINYYQEKGKKFYKRAKDYCKEAKNYSGNRKYERIMLCARYFAMAGENYCGAGDHFLKRSLQTNNKEFLFYSKSYYSLCESSGRLSEQTALRADWI